MNFSTRLFTNLTPPKFALGRVALWVLVAIGLSSPLVAQQCVDDEVMDLDFWFRADAENYADQVRVNLVTDRSPNGVLLRMPTAGRQPTYIVNGINFNPVLRFDQSARQVLTGSSSLGNIGSTPREVFTVTSNLTGVAGGILQISNQNVTVPPTGGNIGYGYDPAQQAVRIYTQGRQGPDALIPLSGITTSEVIIGEFLNQNGNLNSYSHRANATTSGTSSTATPFTISPVSNLLNLGGILSGGNTFFLNGNLAEVLYFDKELTPAQRQAIRSYLGLKYGLTYQQNYVSIDETVTYWTSGNGYDNNVVGLVRDDCAELYQKQTRSSNEGAIISLAAGTFADNNFFNTATFDDGNSLVVGHDATTVGTNFSLADISIAGEECRNFRTDRTWNFQETGTSIGPVTIRLDVDNPAYDLPDLPPGATTYALYLDDDGDFTNGGTTVFPMTESDGLYDVSVAAADRATKAFWTFGAQLTNTYSATFAAGNTTSGSEGNLSAVTYTVSLPFANDAPTEVTIEVDPASTMDAAEYTLIPAGSVTIPAGQTTATFQLEVIDDEIIEGTENIVFTIPSVMVGGRTCTPDVPPTLTLTVLDDDVTFTATGNTPICPVDMDGSITIEATDPLPPAPPFSVTYTGTASNTVSGFSTNPFTLDNLASGTYMLTVTDGDNRMEELTVTIGVPTAGPTCDGDGDGVPDAVEIAEGTDPNDVASFDDADEDGVPDYVELTDPNESGDADNDELTDTQEACGLNAYTDFDEDGIPLYLDENDLDAAAVTPLLQPAFDLDRDGLADFKDTITDQDGDGTPDFIEAVEGTNPADSLSFLDADGDGNSDYVEGLGFPDSDVDGDGISDVIETGGENNSPYDDFDQDGKPAYLDSNDSLITAGIDPVLRIQPAYDADGNGIPEFQDPEDDFDGDGIPNCIEFAEGSDPADATDFRDSDNNGVADFLQVLRYTDATRCTQDSDGDGLSDAVESGGKDPYEDPDGDCVPAYLDAFPTEGSAPADKTNLIVVPAFDVDGDGLPDYLDSNPDEDDDGVPDYVEIAEGTLLRNGARFVDSDDDGIADFAEVATDFATSDSDDDGVTDMMEIAAMTSPYLDEDCDGVPAYLDRDDSNPRLGGNNGRVNRNFDVDRNGIAEWQDPNNDSDGDGVPNRIEVAEGSDPKDGDPTTGCLDSDNNGVCDFVQNTSQLDPADPAFVAADSDGDGFPDLQESCGLMPYADKDGDGIPAYLDDNDDSDVIGNDDGAVQASFDIDRDGLADFMDPDADADDDGVPDFIEGADFPTPMMRLIFLMRTWMASPIT